MFLQKFQMMAQSQVIFLEKKAKKHPKNNPQKDKEVLFQPGFIQYYIQQLWYCLKKLLIILFDLRSMAARQMINQLKQEIQSSIIQRFTCFQKQISHQLHSVKQFIEKQDFLNTKQQDNNKKLEADISILKLLCLEQSQKVESLKNQIGKIPEDIHVVPNIQSSKTLHQKEQENRSRSFIKRQNSTKTQTKLQSPLKIVQPHFRQSVPVIGSFFTHNALPKKAEELPPVDSVSNSQYPRLHSSPGGQISIQLRDALMVAGEQFRNSFKFKESLNYYFQANEVCQKLKEEEMNSQGQILFWIASNFSQLGNHNQAIKYYKEELAVREAAKQTNSENVAATLNNIGHNYYLKKEYRKAVQYFQSAIDMQIKVKGHRDSFVGLYLKNLGEVQFNLGNHPSAQKCCLKAIDSLQKTRDSTGQISAWCHYYLASIYYKSKKYSEVAQHVIDSLNSFLIESKRNEFKQMLRGTLRHSGQKQDVLKLANAALKILSEEGPKNQQQQHYIII